ncbi:hypothetical protein M8C21_014279 [Ambrosia artemisiifolia]|uniref:Trehalose 6-phosphate phosphatase n=1 Tax=Ambrosia artemisiifolia TaxID=4212 RepID=A0AAD5D3U8_AMBAR|nr:hypothetical protein M8C21_014279 [Ambrosia artemisiifolia]
MTKQKVVVADAKSAVNTAAVEVSPPLFTADVKKPPLNPGGFITVNKRKLLDNIEINGGTRINTWVESMRASSPTSNRRVSQDQMTWMERHPSALDMFGEIMNVSKGKQIVMFLDYDGTLSPIVDDPDRAYMSDAVYGLLMEKTKSTPGAKVENNKFCLSVHFRCVEEKKWNELAAQVRSVLKDYPKLRLSQGRKVLEIRPTIKWDKGKALEFLLESLGYANCTDVFPIYIGDDRTDEDAFMVSL